MTTALGTSRGSSTSRRRGALLVLGLLVALVAISVVNRQDVAFGDPLDPRNPGRDGAQAVAEVLAHQGVEVRIARGQGALLEERVDSGTAVVVTNPGQLGESTLDDLLDLVGGAGSLVVVGRADLLAGLFDLDSGSAPTGATAAACDLPLAEGLVVRTYGGRGLAAPGCFGADGRSTLLRQDNRWLMTSPDSFTNDHVLERDNGALALRLLGQQDRLVWYVADTADTAVTDGTVLSNLLPRWLEPGLYLLLASVLGLVLWRGRRLGPLVSEPLPVVVRAAESTQSRGRIYRRTGDRVHAGAILARATRRRLTMALQLPRDSTTETLATAVAARTGRDPREVLALLDGPAVTKDSQLVELGQRLNALENEVRTP